MLSIFFATSVACSAALRRWALPAVVLCSLASWASAQLPTPQLTSIFPCGGRQGTAVELRLSGGAELDGLDRLLFSHPGITAKPKLADPLAPGSPGQPIVSQFVVSIAADVPPGVYELWAAGPLGVTNPRAFAVGTLAEVSEEPGNNTPDKPMRIEMGSIVNGQAAATSSDFYRFSARRGQRVLLDVWAERIDSKMDATLLLHDAAGREVARNRDTSGRDPLIDFPVPADGDYLLTVYDFAYQGGADYVYRLVASSGPYIDFMLPAAGRAGTKGTASVYGRNLPGGKPVEGVRVQGRTLERIEAPVEFPGGDAAHNLVWHGASPARLALVDGFEFRLGSGSTASDPYLLGLATTAVAVEQEPNNEPAKAQRLTVPVEVDGQFTPRGDQDWFEFEAKKGSVYWIEIVSHRMNHAADPYLLVERVVKKPDGKEEVSQLAEADDLPAGPPGPMYNLASNDPAYRFEAPADGLYRLMVRDLYDTASDPRNVYRLSIREPAPDFGLVAVSVYPTVAKDVKPWSTVVPRGGAATIEVLAVRRDGFAGEIEISVEGLPPQVACRGAALGPNQERAVLVFTATDDAAVWAGLIRIVGRAKLASGTIVREARSGVATSASTQQRQADFRRTQQTVLAVTSDSIPVAIELGDGKKLEAPIGGKLEIPVKVTRRANNKENVALVPGELPPGFKVANLAIAPDKNEGKLTVEIAGTVPAGTFSLGVKAQVKVSYRRGESLAVEATKAKQEIDKLLAAATAASQQAEKDKQAADKASQDADAQAKQAPEPKRAEAQAAAKTAAERKTQAAARATEAAARLKTITAAKATADKRATDTEAAAKAKDVNTVIASTVAQITVVPPPPKGAK